MIYRLPKKPFSSPCSARQLKVFFFLKEPALVPSKGSNQLKKSMERDALKNIF